MVMGKPSDSVFDRSSMFDLYLKNTGQVLAKIVRGMVFHTSYRTVHRHGKLLVLTIKMTIRVRFAVGADSNRVGASSLKNPRTSVSSHRLFSTSKASSSNLSHFAR